MNSEIEPNVHREQADELVTLRRLCAAHQEETARALARAEKAEAERDAALATTMEHEASRYLRRAELAEKECDRLRFALARATGRCSA